MIYFLVESNHWFLLELTNTSFEVLKPITEARNSRGISGCCRVHNATKTTDFVTAGDQPKAGRKKGPASNCPNWQLSVDLEKQLRFHKHIVGFTLGPDILQVSERTKSIMIMQLTGPWKDFLGEAWVRKRTKCEHLVINCCSGGQPVSNLY